MCRLLGTTGKTHKASKYACSFTLAQLGRVQATRERCAEVDQSAIAHIFNVENGYYSQEHAGM